jgi:hypothetical protein
MKADELRLHMEKTSGRLVEMSAGDFQFPPFNKLVTILDCLRLLER